MLTNALPRTEPSPKPSPEPSMNYSNRPKEGRPKHTANEKKQCLDFSTTASINELAVQCAKEKEACEDKNLRRGQFQYIVK